MKTLTNQTYARAMTMLELLIVIAVLLSLAAILLPALAKAKVRSAKTSCVNNLRQVGFAFRIWQEDHNNKFPMTISVTNGGTLELIENGTVWRHFQVMSNELNTPRILICPQDVKRYKHSAAIWGGLPSPPSATVPFSGDVNTSYFISVDADSTNPTMFLAGDRNLTVKNIALKPGLHSLATNKVVGWTAEIHVNQGNVLMADASVKQFNSSGLQKALGETGVATNRLALP